MPWIKSKFFAFFLFLTFFLIVEQNYSLTSDLSVSNFHDIRITKIESLNQIPNVQPPQTIYFFDVDDTLIDSPYMLGSKAWRKYIAEATKHDQTENWHDFFSLFLARNHPLDTVETITSDFLQALQLQGYEIFGLTARERKIWYETPSNDVDLLTINQLESLGITFNHAVLDLTHPHLTSHPEYFKGIFFADILPKGEFLLKLFKDSPELPKKVIFIDDSQRHVESVSAVLNLLGINNECYWYTATDKKVNIFEPLIANIQLYYFWMSECSSVISDEDAASIAKQHPERNAKYYLQFVLNNARAHKTKETLCLIK